MGGEPTPGPSGPPLDPPSPGDGSSPELNPEGETSSKYTLNEIKHGRINGFKLVKDESPSQTSDKIKDILFAKTAEKINTIRPNVAASLFDEPSLEIEDEVEVTDELEVDQEVESEE